MENGAHIPQIRSPGLPDPSRKTKENQCQLSFFKVTDVYDLMNDLVRYRWINLDMFRLMSYSTCDI